MDVFHGDFIEKLEGIVGLSRRVNGEDTWKILTMMHEHIDEIEELYSNNNEHWIVETGDLIILALESLLLENKDVNEMLSKCLPRFEVKLRSLLSE